MSDRGTDLGQEQGGDSGMALAIYVLYLVGLVFAITFLVGLVMAYAVRGDAPAWLKTHYRYQIRTFWIGLLLTAVSAILIFFYIGWLLLLLVPIWLIVRCAKGISLLPKRRPISNVETWMFP